MLGKLMKYDLRSGIRTFSLIWIGLALLGAINGLTIRFVLAGDTQSGLVSFVFGVLPMILLVALYVAMGIFVLVFIIDRFYKGLLGNEGYLMFTLPVTRKMSACLGLPVLMIPNRSTSKPGHSAASTSMSQPLQLEAS